VQSALWFQIDDIPAAGHAYGLFRDDGSAKPAAARFRELATYEGRRADGSREDAIAAYFDAHGGMEENGSPYDNGGSAWVHGWDYGDVQDFDGGAIGRCAIFSIGGAAHRVARGFWGAYLERGLHDRLRFPVSDEYADGGGTRQDFQGGHLTWRPDRGVEVH
jgi:uncharacterized protein with LGFP repeats